MSVSSAPADTAPAPMPKLLRERLTIQLVTSGLSLSEASWELTAIATAGGYKTTGLSRAALGRTVVNYRDRIRAEATDELADAWEDQRQRLYGDLTLFRVQLVRAREDNEPFAVLDRMHARVMRIEGMIAKLEGNYQSAAVDLTPEDIDRYADSIGISSADLMERAREIARGAASGTSRGCLAAPVFSLKHR